jgi:hypothetical protein
MEHKDTETGPQANTDRLEERADALGEHIEQARAASERAEQTSDLPFAVGNFNDDSSDAPGGEGVPPEANYTRRGD